MTGGRFLRSALSFFHQKQQGHLSENSAELSNAIIEYSLRLLGYSHSEIENAIEEVEKYIEKEHITTDEYFKFQAQ